MSIYTDWEATMMAAIPAHPSIAEIVAVVLDKGNFDGILLPTTVGGTLRQHILDIAGAAEMVGDRTWLPAGAPLPSRCTVRPQ
jgi:hypothetical protein